jgi:hypothetical protein
MAKSDNKPGPQNIEPTINKDVPTVQEKRALFQSYTEAHDKTLAIEAQIQAAKDAEGSIVEKIIEKCGNGPFSYKGQILTAVVRNNKDGSKTYFFKRPGQAEITEI